MKKILLAAFMLFVGIGVFAQKGLGEYIELDGVPAFAKFYFGGLGKENSLGIKFQYHAKDLCSSELIQQSLFVMVFYGLYSSTCSNVKAGFRKLRCEMVPLTGKHWLEIFDTYSGHAPLVCAVREF